MKKMTKYLFSMLSIEVVLALLSFVSIWLGNLTLAFIFYVLMGLTFFMMFIGFAIPLIIYHEIKQWRRKK